jgi:hypothetical protein
MRLAWYSNSPTAPTGYGTQTAQVCSRLKAAGHDVQIISNFGHGSGTGIQLWGDIPVWPQGATQYSLDILDAAIDRIDPDFVITLYDAWVLKGVTMAERPSISWVPIDHYPASPEVVSWLKGADDGRPKPAIAMSEYGRNALANEGVNVGLIPHAIDTRHTFVNRGPEKGRERLNVPADAFLIGINAANIGKFPPRKMWVENLAGAAAFMREHDNAYLYLHTDVIRPNGVDLRYWLQVLELPEDRVRAVDPLAYRVGLTSDADLSYLYSAFDVQLLCSGGEGFGIPVIEGMACNAPAIVTDFSAQPELVGDTGWRVPFQLSPDYGQGAFLATPRIDGIVNALEEAYAEKESGELESRGQRARERAELYDADTVFEAAWLPLLEQMGVASNKAKAAKAGLSLPPNAGQLVAPDGTALRGADTIRPKGQKRKSNKRRG